MNDQGICTDQELRQAWATANASDAVVSAHESRPRGPADRDESAWAAPGWATGLALLLVPVAVMFGGLSAMATDSCGPDHCSRALNEALGIIVGGLYASLFGTPAMLLTAWVLPRKMRYAVSRRAIAWCALLPPLAVIFMVFTLPQG
ncbi:hypothetical protein [Streptomyces sp. NPDC001415]